MLKKSEIIIVLFLFLVSCESEYSYYPSRKEKLVDSVMFQVASKLKKEKSLSPFGSGGRTMNKVTLLRLAFKYYKPVDFEQGRKLVIDAATEFVEQINAKEELRQYLYRYPFQLEDVEIEIYVENLDRTPMKSGAIEIVNLVRGRINFEADDPGYPFMRTIHHETIEEALSQIANPSAEPLVLKPLPRTKLPEPGDKKMGIGFCG